MRYFIFTLLFSLSSIPCLAQQVSSNLSPKSGSTADQFELTVQVIGAGDIDTPQFEHSDDFSVVGQGSSQYFSWINGKQSTRVQFSFNVIPRDDLKPGDYLLPKGQVSVDGRSFEISSKRVEISKTKKLEGLDFTQLFERKEVYQGEQVIYRTEFASELGVQNFELENLDTTDFLREDMGRPQERIRSIGRSRIRRYTTREAFFPLKPGKLSVPERGMTAKLYSARQPRSPLDRVFAESLIRFNSRVTRKRLVAEPAEITVKPLPDPPKPLSGYIPVGRLKMRSSVDATSIDQGESVTLNITLEGDANLRSYKLPAPSGVDVEKFKLYYNEPKISSDSSGAKIWFRKSFSLAAVPRESGKLELPQFEIVYFDLVKKEYLALNTPAKIIDVVPDPNAPVVEPIVENVEVAPTEIPEVEKAEEKYIGPSGTGSPLSPIVYFCLLLLLPILTLGYWITKRKKEDVATKRVASLPDLQKMDNLQQAEFTEMLGAEIRQFISERLGIPALSMTHKELANSLNDLGIPRVTQDLAEELLRELEHSRYSGKALENQSDLLSRADRLIAEIDKA